MNNIEPIQTLLSYNPDTGDLTWIKNNRRGWAGKSAGHKNPKTRCVEVRVNYRLHKAHRLAWLIYHGREPNGVIDHIDGNPFNNAIGNLRECDQTLNGANKRRQTNNKSGFKGVSFAPREKLFVAQLVMRGKRKHQSYHETAEEAHEAYKAAALQHFGSFARFK